MTQQDYEQKRRECWEEFKRTNLDGEVQWQPVSRYDVFCAAFDRAYSLGKHSQKIFDNALGKQTETISQEDIQKAAEKYSQSLGKSRDVTWNDGEYGFIAGANYALGKQEKDADTVIQGWVARCEEGYIDLFQGSPSRSAYYKYGRRYGCWTDDYDHHIELPREMFPDLTWDDDPEPVEIIIKRKKK